MPEGSYRPRVRLVRQRRTITLPNPIRVDVTPPTVERFAVAPRVFSPDGDRRNETVVVGYRISEPAEVALYVDGARQVLKRGQKPEGEIRWFGLVDGEPAQRGIYTLQVGATDLAGNVAQRSRGIDVVVRYVALGRKRIAVGRGQALRRPRPLRRRADAMAARRAHRRRPAGNAAPARAGRARSLRARRLDQRPRRPSGGGRRPSAGGAG